MRDNDLVPSAAQAPRLGLGVTFLAHSVWLKGLRSHPPGTVVFFQSIGPARRARLRRGAVEAIGGPDAGRGASGVVVALALLPVVLGATGRIWPNGWLFTNPDGGFEYPLFLALATFVQVLLARGSGARAAGARPLPAQA